jgi:probable rRNA maturation factor
MFRSKATTTDVLSFPHEPDEFDPDKDNLGDIVISVEQAQKQAAENGLTLEGEIKQLILHGLLHLCGYDHETDDGEMNELELVLRVQLAIQ